MRTCERTGNALPLAHVRDALAAAFEKLRKRVEGHRFPGRREAEKERGHCLLRETRPGKYTAELARSF